MNKVIVYFLIFILIISSIFISGCGGCNDDSDCVVDNCCNPTMCVLKNKTSEDCSSILICEVTPPEVECKCVKGECIITP